MTTIIIGYYNFLLHLSANVITECMLRKCPPYLCEAGHTIWKVGERFGQGTDERERHERHLGGEHVILVGQDVDGERSHGELGTELVHEATVNWEQSWFMKPL